MAAISSFSVYTDTDEALDWVRAQARRAGHRFVFIRNRGLVEITEYLDDWIWHAKLVKDSIGRVHCITSFTQLAVAHSEEECRRLAASMGWTQEMESVKVKKPKAGPLSRLLGRCKLI